MYGRFVLDVRAVFLFVFRIGCFGYLFLEVESRFGGWSGKGEFGECRTFKRLG